MFKVDVATSIQSLTDAGIAIKPYTTVRNEATGRVDVPGIILYTPAISFFAPIYNNENGCFVPMPGVKSTIGDNYLRYVEFEKDIYTAILEVAKKDVPAIGEVTPWYLQDVIGNTIDAFGIEKIDIITNLTQAQIDAGVSAKLVLHCGTYEVSGITVFETNDAKELTIRMPQGVRLADGLEKVILSWLHPQYTFGERATAVATRVKRQAPAQQQPAATGGADGGEQVEPAVAPEGSLRQGTGDDDLPF